MGVRCAGCLPLVCSVLLGGLLTAADATSTLPTVAVALVGVRTTLDFHRPDGPSTGMTAPVDPQRGANTVALSLAIRPPAGWLVLSSSVDRAVVACDDAGSALAPLLAAPDSFFSPNLRNPFLSDPDQAFQPELEARFLLPGHPCQRLTGVSLALHALVCVRTDLTWRDIPLAGGTPAPVPGVPAAHLTLQVQGPSLIVTCMDLDFEPVYQLLALDAGGTHLRARSIMAQTAGPRTIVTLNMGVPIAKLRVQVAQHLVALRAEYALGNIPLTVSPPSALLVPIPPRSECLDPLPGMSDSVTAAPAKANF